MTIEESLQGVRRLFLDSAPVIYFIEQHPQYFPSVRVVFERIQNSSILGVTSPITLAECLVRPYRLEQTQLPRRGKGERVRGKGKELKTFPHRYKAPLFKDGEQKRRFLRHVVR